MSLYILGGLGLLIAAVSVIAFWAIVVGGAGVVSLLFWIIEQICACLRAIMSLLPSLLEVLAVHLSQGQLSIYQQFTRPGAYPVTQLTFPALPGGSHPGQQNTANNDEIIPHAIVTEEIMSNPHKNASLLFIGPFGSRMLSPLSEKIAALRAADVLLTSGHLDLSIPGASGALPGTVDITPDMGMRNTALLHGETEGKAYQTLVQYMGERLVETHLKTKASPAPLLFFLDASVFSAVPDMLRAIKQRLPLHPLAVVTSLSAQDVGQKEIRQGLTDLYTLYTEGILETILVIDPRSAFAQPYGEETQHQFLAHMLVSMLIANRHSVHNLSGTQVLQTMHSLSPLTSVSFASEVVALGNPPKRWAWLPGIKHQAGSGSYSDILVQTRRAIDTVITKDAARAFAAPVGTETDCFVFCSEPIGLDDDRFEQSVRDTASYIGRTYSFARAIITRGNGSAYPHQLGGRYRVQATCLYPVHPAMFTRPQAKKRLPAMLPVSNTPAQSQPIVEPESGPTSSQAVKTPRQPSASTTRRGRKKTGQ